MGFADSFVRELDAEMASTRRLLERLPAGKLDWKPHVKSKSLGELATHVVELPRFGIRVRKDAFQVGSEKPPAMSATADFLARFDENVAGARAAVAELTSERLKEEFRVLRPDGDIFFARSRAALLRGILLNHHIHHRGQLTVYYRLLDVPLPPIYGPTADEGLDGPARPGG